MIVWLLLTFYKEYLKSKKTGIQKVNLPGFEDVVRCWLNGENYYLERKYKETENIKSYEFYPDGEIKEKLPHRISRFGYYDVYSDMNRSPILFYENEYYKGIFFALTLNSNGLFQLF